MKSVTLLGIPLFAGTRDEAIELIHTSLDNHERCVIATPNPEMLVDASRDPEFANILQVTQLRIPDGFGLILVSRLMGQHIPERITGTDFMKDLLEIAAKRNLRVYFLGAQGDTAAKAAHKLQEKIPHWTLAEAESGGTATSTPNPELITRINATQPDIIFVAWGHPIQERWLAQALPQLPSIKIAMGVGGAFDFYAGTIRRAPKIIQRLGFEWLWRLAHQPSRIKRIIKALIVFPYLVFTRKT
jgi:N-acetylglucosaminyldiphosphoundecaprenol N-acetyl-beta-D-mannosaminyltransferase